VHFSFIKFLLFFVSLSVATFEHLALAQDNQDANGERYVLKNLSPLGLNRYILSRNGETREYFRLRNAKGVHHLIYEENPAMAPVPELKQLRDKMTKSKAACDIELHCVTNAFCTGTCKNLYYEIKNTPPDPKNISRHNHCKVHALQCTEEKR
jgi:hypothetical protein